MADAVIRITAVDQASAVIDKIGRSLGSFAAAVGGTISVVAGLKAALDFGDTLQTANEQLGISVDKLQELSAIAIQSNTSLEGFARGFKSLGQAMVQAQNSASEQGRIFKALGVTVKDSVGNLRAVDDVSADVADALNKIGNEALRTTAGVAIYGKGYTQIAAALRTFRDSQAQANEMIKQFGAISSISTRAADALGDRLKLIGEGFKAATLTGLTGGLAALEASLRTITPLAAQLSKSFGEFFGWLGEKGAILLINTAAGFQKIGTVIAAIAASIMTLSRDPMREANADLARLEAERAAGVDAARASAKFGVGGENVGEKFLAGEKDRLRQMAVDAKALSAALTSVTVNKTTEALERLVKSQEDALASELKLTEVDKLYIALSNMKLGALTKEQIELVKRATLAAQQKDAAKALEDSLKAQTKATEEYNKAWVDKIETDANAYEGELKRIETGTDLIKQMEFELKLMTMTDAEREKEIALRKLQTLGIDETSEAYKNFQKRMEEIVAEKGAMQRQIDLWKDIENAAHDAFMHIFESGRSVWERLTASLKATLLETLYQITLKRWIINIGASITGIGGTGGAVASGGGGLGSIGGLSNLTSLFGGIGSLAGGAGSGILGSIGASFANLNLAMTGGVQAIGGFSSALTASLPALGVIAGIGVAGYAIYQYLEGKKGGPKEAGFGSVGMVSEGAGSFFPNEYTAGGNKVAGDLVASLQKSFVDAVKRLGGKPMDFGFALGFDTDPKGTALSRIIGGVYKAGANIYKDINASVGRSPEELTAALETQAKQMLLAALKASDLPGKLGEVFASAGDISGDALDNLLNFAYAYKDLANVFNANPLDDALNAVKDAASGAQAALAKQGEALLDLLDIYDGSAQSTADLSTATQGYYNNLVTLIAQIEQVKTAVADMFASSIKTYTFSTLDTKGKYQYLQEEAAALEKELRTSTDANRINALAQMIDADMREAFGLLTPEQQKQMATEFIKGAKDTSAAAAERLTKVQQQQEEKFNTVLTAVQTALDGAADKIAGGGDAVFAGGEAILHAAGIMMARPGRTGSLVTG